MEIKTKASCTLRERNKSKVFRALKAAYNANIDAHMERNKMWELSNFRDIPGVNAEYKAHWSKRDKYYKKKNEAIKQAVRFIKIHHCWIAYWERDWIIYFEYDWKQITFHTDKGEPLGLKWTSIVWNWKTNTTFPFEEYIINE